MKRALFFLLIPAVVLAGPFQKVPGEKMDERDVVSINRNFQRIDDIYNSITWAISLVRGWTNNQTSMFDDLVVPLTTTVRGATSKPDFDYSNIGYLFPQNDTTEQLYFVVQLPHSYKEGSTVYPHVHWLQSADQNVTWRFAYYWHNPGDTLSIVFSTISVNTLAYTYSSGSIHQISTRTSGISGTGKQISSILLCKLFRNDNVYTGDALAFQFDLHIEKDTLGSAQEYTK